MAAISNKLSMKTMGYSKDKLQKLCFTVDSAGEIQRVADGMEHWGLIRIVGVVTGLRPGQTDMGPFVALIGEFQAVRSDGEKFAGSKLLLPKFLEDMIAGRQASENQPLEFAVEIGIKVDSTSAVGYAYVGRSLIEIKPSSRLEALMNAAAAVPMLPNSVAPTTQAAEAVPEVEGKGKGKRK